MKIYKKGREVENQGEKRKIKKRREKSTRE